MYMAVYSIASLKKKVIIIGQKKEFFGTERQASVTLNTTEGQE